MLETLFKYLIQQKSLYLPGIGNFVMTQDAPVYNAADQTFEPPVWKAVLTDEQPATPKELFAFIAGEKQVTELEAIQMFNGCIFEIRQHIKSGRSFYWKGIGELKAGDSSTQTILDAETISLSFLKPVAARRIVRDNAVHTVLIGNQELTNVEVAEMKKNTGALGRQRWWVYAAAVAVIALILLFFHFYSLQTGQHPFGNRSLIDL
ncbi:MAG TPA: hypothetical protein VIK74_05100 [Parasegetibacter sp.]